ncbi:hypothetical protein M8J75_005550 [Diaphorina citri]|nr:hypothetical protein M8J75_005550 [Diaphorina citri]
MDLTPKSRGTSSKPIIHNDQQFVLGYPLKDGTLLYKCCERSCLARIKQISHTMRARLANRGVVGVLLIYHLHLTFRTPQHLVHKTPPVHLQYLVQVMTDMMR